MEHSFNVDIARECGIEEAIFIHNMYFWIKKNAANNVHLYDGRRWTYNSVKAYAELFPYMNENKIYRIIKSLANNDIIIKGNYNENKYVQTSWYAFTDKGLEMLKQCGYDILKLSESSLLNQEVHFAKTQNVFCKNTKCITDNNTDSKTYDNTPLPPKGRMSKKGVSVDMGYVLPEFKETFFDWLEYKKERKESYKTEKSTKLCYDKLVKLSGNNPAVAREIIEQSMANNWAGLFELKTDNRYEQRVNDNRRDSERRKLNSAIAVSTRVQEAAAKRLAELKAEGVID